MKALIDTGELISLNESKHRGLGKWGWLKRPDIKISQADGRPMKIMGKVRLPVEIRGTRSVHNFYVTKISVEMQC